MGDDRGERFIRSHPARYEIFFGPKSGTLFDLFLKMYVATRKLSIPWFHWPTQLSLFHHESESGSNNNVGQFNNPKKTEAKKVSPFSEPNSGPSPPEPSEPVRRAKKERKDVDEIHRLVQNPVLYNPLRAPRYPIILCHGAPLDSKEPTQT